MDMDLTDRTDWYPWTFNLDDSAMGEIDLRCFLDPPAGKHGFATVREDGHFYFEDGTRVRFFGTNVGGSSCCPDKKVAEVTASRLARFGMNLVRLHAPDSRWAKLIDYDKGDSRGFLQEALDRYDYFVYQLKERGIYVYFDLLDYRHFLPGDEVRDAENLDVRWENSIKGASIFDRQMIELQKEFATQLLTHQNPYTGLRYVDEPALAIQEITNENSLFYLANTRLMLTSYQEDVKRLWNDWLAAQYGDRMGLARAWTSPAGECALLPDEDPVQGTVLFPVEHLYADLSEAPLVGEKSPVRLNAIQRFLYEKQIAYYDEMMDHLRSLGLKCPITGTNQDFSATSNFANARCQFMTRNNYWCHPNVRSRPMQFNNIAMVQADLRRQMTLVANVASSAVAGKAILSPEFNCPWPNEWRAECLPLMACYGRLQDWDGLLFFAYNPDRADREALTSFGTQSDPVHWGQIPLAALVFHRGDVSVARQVVHVGISETDCFATRPRRTDGGTPYGVLPFLHKVRNAYPGEIHAGDADLVLATDDSEGEGRLTPARQVAPFYEWAPSDGPADCFCSDTGELALDTAKGVFTAITDTAVIATGFLSGAGKLTLGPVDVTCGTPFASVSLISLDGKPLVDAGRILLTAVARSANSGQVLAAAHSPDGREATDADTGGALRTGRHVLAEAGSPPVLAEPVDAEITIKTRVNLTAFSLSPQGKRQSKASVIQAEDGVSLHTREVRSPWVLLVRG